MMLRFTSTRTFVPVFETPVAHKPCDSGMQRELVLAGSLDAAARWGRIWSLPSPRPLQVVKLGIFYFLSTSLIIFPTAIGGAALGLVGSTRYLRKRHLIGSFDAARVFPRPHPALNVSITSLPCHPPNHTPTPARPQCDRSLRHPATGRRTKSCVISSGRH